MANYFRHSTNNLMNEWVTINCTRTCYNFLIFQCCIFIRGKENNNFWHVQVSQLRVGLGKLQSSAICSLPPVCFFCVCVCVCGLWAKNDFWMVETNKKNQKEDNILWYVKLYENSSFCTPKQSFMFIYLHTFCFHTAKEELCMTDSI